MKDTTFPTFEPKPLNRFIVKIDDIPSYLIHSVTRPSCTSVGGIPSTWRWNPINIIVWDSIVPSIAQICYKFTNNVDSNKLGNIIIELLGPVGDSIERWTLHDCYVSHIDFGNKTLDWTDESKDLSEIKLTVQYSHAVLEY